MRKRMILMVLVTAAALVTEFPAIRNGIRVVIEIVKQIPDTVFGE